nr:PREDICTED: uncharacterized protein LOC109032696 [Bemisia tabaci]
MAMGEFRRTHSKVWWSHYPSDDGDDEDGPSGSAAGHPWGPGAAPSPHWGPGLSLSGIGERRFSSSPSSGSHKSQDSGFSDSESSSPSGSTRSTSGTKINKSPLKEEEDEARDDVSDGVRDDVSDGVRDDVSDGVRDDVSDGVRDDVSDGVRDDVSDGSTPEPKFVDPMLLRIPLSRIPRVCLAHKSKPDPEAESKIAPNENIILDIKEEVSQDELTRRYKTEPRKCEPSYQRHSVSLELHSSPFQFQLPPKFNSMECLLNEQNLFSSTRNTPRRRSSLTDDSDASPPPSPKPVRKSTCKIVEEIPKKSFLQALNASRLDSSEKENIQPNLNSSAESRIPDKNSNLSRPLEKNSKKSLPIGKSLRECRPCEKNSTESHPSDSFTECRPCEKNSNESHPSDSFTECRPCGKSSSESHPSEEEFRPCEANSSESHPSGKERLSCEKNSPSGKNSSESQSCETQEGEGGACDKTASAEKDPWVTSQVVESGWKESFREEIREKTSKYKETVFCGTSDKTSSDNERTGRYSSIIQITAERTSVCDRVTEGLERIPEESPTSTTSEETVRFIGNIDLSKTEERDERNVATGEDKDKTSKSNLSWSPIKSETEEVDGSPNKTVVFGAASELPGAPSHTSTPKGVPAPNRARRDQRRLSRKGLFLQQETKSNWDSSVAQWLFELGTRYEAECMTTLQHKCLTTGHSQKVSVITAASSQFVRDLQQRTKCIAAEFSKLYRHAESESKEQVGPSVQSLVGLLDEFTQYIRKTMTSASIFNFSSREENELLRISKACNRLKATTNDIPLKFSCFSSDLSHVGKLFSQFVDSLLKCQIKSLIQILEEPASDVTLLSALSGLTGMGLEATHLASLVARCNGVRAILAICLDSRWTTVRIAALRTLATVCCSAQSIRQLEKARGVEVLADLLSDEKKSEAELSEAASVLAQITAPWIEDNHKVEGLQDFINIFVTSLTRLVQKTKSSETLLLASAALANLSFMEPKAVYALLEMGSAGYLLAAVRKLGARASVFLQEQAATMIANMAAVAETREHLAKHRAVVALLCFLQVRHSPLQRSSEIAAAERLQHKSAIALSRLCSDPEVSQQVVELHGVGRLVRLCKEKRERNHSDAVLVACLAALRKITKNCGTTIMEENDVSQLVEPRLLDSFLTYSSKQESYV